MQRTMTLLLTAALGLVLAACGGGGYDAPPAAPAADLLAELPASASQSSAGMASYVSTLVTLPADQREPVSVDGFSPPRPEDSEPESIAG